MSANLIAPSPLGNRENNSFLDKLKSKQKNSSDWKKIIYYLSWSGLIFFGSVVFFKVTNYISFHFFSERLIFNFPWLAYLDIFLFIFILIDFIVINNFFRFRNSTCEKFLLSTIVILFIFNYTWFIGKSYYNWLGIYDFHSDQYNFFLLISLLFLPSVQNWFLRLYARVKNNVQIPPQKKHGRVNKKVIVYILGLLSIVAISFSFNLTSSLGNFMTVDEHRWIQTDSRVPSYPTSYDEALDSSFINSSYARSIGYWKSYLSGNIAATFNNANPSATVNFLHFIAYLIKDQVNYHTYILLSRLIFVIHNLLMLFVLYYASSKIFSKKTTLIIIALLGLSPLFIGFSRIINHDSIQGLYGIAFILFFLVAMKKQLLKYFFWSGVFLALSIMTQFKMEFLIPLFFAFPLFYSYIYKDVRYITIFVRGLPKFFFGVIITSIIILPAVIVYPQILTTRFFFYPNQLFFLTTITIVYVVYFGLVHQKKIESIFRKLQKFESIFVRIVVLIILFAIVYSVYHTIPILNGSFNMARVDYMDATIGTFIVFFYSSPLVILGFFLLWLIKKMIRPSLDISFILVNIFFFLIFFGVFTLYSRLKGGYSLLETKYLFVILPIFIFGIVSDIHFEKIKPWIYWGILCIIVSSLIGINISAKPYFKDYNNALLPEGYLITRTTYALDTIQTSQYINKHFSNIMVYNPRGQLENLVKSGINVIGWDRKFWEYRPDYVIVEWEKNHAFAPIFDYYREHETPIWSVKRNGVIYSGIYTFNPNVPYDKLINPGNTLNGNVGTKKN